MKPDPFSPVTLERFPPEATVVSHPPAASPSHAVRNGLLSTLIFTACFWISWPVAQMGFIDDWSYIESAQVFANTGHLVYNGWATAMLGWQILWGALFIRLFGFSFMTVKLSTLPIAMACVFLFYLIQTRFGISPRNAVLGTLTLGLSPLFLPLAASFMSDIPGLFVILLCLYCCQRAVAARTSAATIAWLSLAAASNVCGGTVRQIAWLGALVMVPSTAWLLHKRRGVFLAASLLWGATFISVLYCMHWFAAQPYSISESLFTPPASPSGHPFFVAFLFIAGEFFCLLLVVLPVIIAWLPRIGSAHGASFIAVAIILPLWVLFQIVANWTLPWVPHLLVAEFSVANIAGMSPYRGPFILPEPARLLFSVLIVAAFLPLLVTACHQLRGPNFMQSIARRPVFWLLLPYSLSYFALLALHSIQEGGDFDRYLLGLMPVAIILLIRLYEIRIAPRIPAISVVTLALFSVLAIAGTHDWFAWQRARLAAIAELRAAGIPRTQIQGGFEYDGWTQIEDGGHVNDTLFTFPPGAYQPHPPVPQVAAPCRLDFAPYTPSVQPRFTVAFNPLPCLSPSKFSPVPYYAWLPPFDRSIYVQRIPPP